MILPLLQFGAMVVVYQLLTAATTVIMPIVMPSTATYYSEFNAVNDVIWFFVMMLLWDRFFGPTGHFFRKVGRLLVKAKESENDYD